MQDATGTDETLALIPVDEQQLDPLKRSRPPSPFSSLKKMKFMMDEFNGNTAPMKKVKIPALPFTAKSLGLVETPSGMLVPAEVMMPKDGGQAAKTDGKKKKGCHLGSKNKNPPKTKNILAEEVLSVFCLGKPPSPSVKGK
ncbi:hypothetical protein RchiOBHm_Chr7g0181741 [Rosa chinensis]|uniref:Uncharacterized protein n=1 Tax=Rosa chinensis TaxID=74649 RepID=A0A2P6P2Q7_ROSCH|nr:hypothetical protein RchiOBHm_Chr7g0181741 [Rosa chinensis]